jgi:hypothetical protein
MLEPSWRDDIAVVASLPLGALLLPMRSWLDLSLQKRSLSTMWFGPLATARGALREIASSDVRAFE